MPDLEIEVRIYKGSTTVPCPLCLEHPCNLVHSRHHRCLLSLQRQLAQVLLVCLPLATET